ncbi:plexin domain-containing protein 2 [Daktulosphaira vitifoliae]|uniref:plexin domain-containing protein 2 n=1 Tax=Daktulosphaira vitifoliae TaxID=58002 RepID=UPI0021A9A996|nr:plexin domain-containing protein 2 [Daktulosphaira vitifoliae]
MSFRIFYAYLVIIIWSIFGAHCVPNEEYFYEVTPHNDQYDVSFELPFDRIKRHLVEPDTNRLKNGSIQTIMPKNNSSPAEKKTNLSITSIVTKDSSNAEVNKVSHEPPVNGNMNNITYSATSQPMSVELPLPISNETLAMNNITKTKNDSHVYYNSTTINESNEFKHYWIELKDHPGANLHGMLSESHRRAATVNLKFQFPFYGHLINVTTIATGGFLYLGEYIHSWLAATQYIAPLMANFDLSTSNDSNIYYMDNGTTFTVTWHNVTLQDKPKAGEFTFQTSLYSNGDIVFAYKFLPLTLKDIDSTSHPVKIGLSDAYVLDKTVFFLRRKTIYEYHRVTFSDVTNGTVIFLKALPTCMEKKNCSSCVKTDTNFQCFWCDNRCSSGLDRYRQEWHKKDCEKLKLSNEDMCTNGIATSTPLSNIYGEKSVEIAEPHANNSTSNTSLFFIALCLSLLVMSTVWILYAYLYPHTRSGQLLIRYRPSQWGWRRGEARYTAATIHM